jgi:phenylpyruvate tautomerase PptA (4-oxalocrotonate tautomerase family)
VPWYECVTVEGALSAEQRTELAGAITATHAEETGAPGDLIHVVFHEMPSGSTYTAGRPSTPTLIRGLVRAGRSPEVRLAIQRRIHDACVRITDATPMSVLIAIIDVPATWAMEAGRVLPEPNKADEQAWFAALKQ